MEKLQARFALAFSPLYTALATGFWVALGLTALAFVGPRPSQSVWIGFVVFLVVGAALQFTSSRVLYIRAYDVVGWSLAALVFAVLAWSVTVVAWGHEGQALAGVVIVAMLMVFAALVFANYYRNPQRARMPYGDMGRMNQNSGAIVDPRYIERSEEVRAKSAAGARTIAYLSPLIAGLTMLMARSLSDNIALLVLIPTGTMLSSVAILVAARYLSFTVSTVQWERKHGKHIYVQR